MEMRGFNQRSRRRLMLVMASGLVLLFIGMSQGAQAASFDCKKAGTKVERMICSDPTLSQLDDELAAVYQVDEDAPASNPRRVAQRAWLAKRNACTNADCVNTQYQVRLTQLLCDPKGPSAGIKQTEISCLSHQLEALEAELRTVERAFAIEVSKDSSDPDFMRKAAEKQARTWRAYRDAKCELYGMREGDGGTWQAFWISNCEVGETRDRIEELKRDSHP